MGGGNARRIRRATIGTLAAVVLYVPVSHAQLPAPPATTEDALHQMVDQAGVIFIGQVTAIRRIESANGSTGILEINFAVDDAVRGAISNSTYTLREWAGVSPAEVPQFEIARRYLMLLHAPGPSGLSSPVGGPDGAIPILSTAEAASPNTPDTAGLAAQAALAPPAPATNTTTALPTAHSMMRMGISSEISASQQSLSSHATASTPASSALASSSPASWSIDLRWITTRAFAPLAYAVSEPASTHPITSRANLVLPSPDLPLSSPSDGPQPFTQSAQSVNRANLLTLLRSWQAQSHAAR